MNTLFFDFETSYKHPDPWDKESFAVCLGLMTHLGTYQEAIFNHKDSLPTPNAIKDIQELFDWADRIVAHNIKFDLHWLRAVGIKLKPQIELYDTMIAEYLIKGQATVGHLSLEELSEIYLSTPKDDKVKMYWKAGYETDEIPLSILLEYMKRDIINTNELYNLQKPILLEKNLSKLIRLQSEVAGVVEDMEWNGMRVDIGACILLEQYCKDTIKRLNEELNYFIVDNLPDLRDIPIKWTSGDHLSTILFGGALKYDGKEEARRTLKDGTVKVYERNAKLSINTAGLGFQPAEGTETSKVGYYQTDKAQIEQLKAKSKHQKRFLEIIREIATAEKMAGTYFKPFQEESVEGRFHASFNQCATVTGRLTCSRLHQIPRSDDAGVKGVFVSEYKSTKGGVMSQQQVGST